MASGQHRQLPSSSSSSEEGCEPHPQLCFALLREAASRREETPRGIGARIRKTVPHLQLSLVGLSCTAAAATSSSHEAPKPTSGRPRWKCFTYDEIAMATSNFHPTNLVGSGGYAKVYKGSLSGGVPIAVKVLNRSEEREFLAEVGILGHISHPNAACLLGFCIGHTRALVFECSPHGSLASYLHQGSGDKTLKWAHRYKVALGVARGLHYLHKQCPRRIIHRDVTSSNILLGPGFEPQISDFGLARWLPQQWTHHTITAVEGTPGYMAPEYLMHGIVDEKTDVYAFGVVLLELITGGKPLEDPVKQLLESGSRSKLVQLVDGRLQGVFNSTEMRRVALAASLCIRSSAILRPSMGKILELLETS